MAIRKTFYTASDDFSSTMSGGDARTWVRTRAPGPSRVTTPEGRSKQGPSVDELDEDDLARWSAALSMGEARRKADEGGYTNVKAGPHEWVSILAERIEAVGCEVVPEENAEPWARWSEESEPVH